MFFLGQSIVHNTIVLNCFFLCMEKLNPYVISKYWVCICLVHYAYMSN